MSIETTCAFTGHREILDSIDFDFFETCVQDLIDRGYDTFLCGMARGFDLLAGEIVVKLKATNPHIKLIACVPCPNQDRYFSLEEKQKYDKVFAACDEVKLLSGRYYKGCMLSRDRYMVDNCSLVFAYDRKKEGGTHYTLTYAQSKKKKIIIM